METTLPTNATAPSAVSPSRSARTLESARRFGRILARTVHHTRRIRKLARTHGTPLPGPLRHPIMTTWAGEMLDAMRVRVRQIGTPARDEAVMLVGNHVSYADIPLLMSVTPVVFIAKKQIASWPVFGDACRAVGTIFVERDSNASRRDAGQAIAPKVKEEKQSIAVFPSGTTTMDEAKPWRRGAFRIAYENGLRVQPIRIRYTPMRRAAYLMEDAFVTHLWGVLGSDGVEATIEFGEPQRIEDPDRDCERLWQWSRAGLPG